MSSKLLPGPVLMFALACSIAWLLPPSPRVQGGPLIPPGGRGGKIRNYFATVQPDSNVVIIPSAEGLHGFVITDIVPTGAAFWRIEVDSGSGFSAIQADTDSSNIHYKSGIPVPAGAAVRFHNIDFFGGGAIAVPTITGYTY